MTSKINFENSFQNISSLIGEPSRAIMLWKLLDGRAYTAGELAVCADISAQSASNHLGKLLNGGLLEIEKQGRHRYYRLSGPDVAHTIESIASLIPDHTQDTLDTSDKPPGIRLARTCYDHFAGRFGVLLTESLLQKGLLIEQGPDYDVTQRGVEFFQSLNVSVEELKQMKRSFARKCLDWSERKHHLAGALGAALLTCFLDNDWVRRKEHSREIVITYAGHENLDRLLQLSTL